MSGFIYNRALCQLTKREIFEYKLGISSGHPIRRWPRRVTWRDWKLAEQKRRGPYWKYRNIRVMRRINFDKRRYGK